MLYLTLRQMEYVAAIARYGSLTAAASVLNVSQPSLSVAISQVESHLGTRLFIRGKGAPVTVTGQGRQFLAGAEAVLAAAKRLEGMTADPASAGTLPQLIRLGVFEDLAPTCLAPILVGVAEHLPAIEVAAEIADFATIAGKLRRGELDLAITYDLGLDASFDCTALYHAEPSAFFAAGQGPDGSTITLQELAEYPLILFEEGVSSQHVLRLFGQSGFQPRVAHRVAGLETMRSFAAQGLGVGISYTTPPGSVSYDGAHLRSLKISDDGAPEPVMLARIADGASQDTTGDLLTRFMSGLFIDRQGRTTGQKDGLREK